jgi:hypothetical protein
MSLPIALIVGLVPCYWGLEGLVRQSVGCMTMSVSPLSETSIDLSRPLGCLYLSSH